MCFGGGAPALPAPAQRAKSPDQDSAATRKRIYGSVLGVSSTRVTGGSGVTETGSTAKKKLLGQ